MTPDITPRIVSPVISESHFSIGYIMHNKLKSKRRGPGPENKSVVCQQTINLKEEETKPVALSMETNLGM